MKMTPTPTSPTADESQPSTDSTKAEDSICSAAALNKPNISAYTENICFLAKIAIAQKPLPKLAPDKAVIPLLNLFVSEVSKRNKIFTTHAEKAETVKDFFLEADKKRTDKQIGSTPSSSGTTSIAVKGGAPSVIGWAGENGAATSSISGNTVTGCPQCVV